MGGWPDARGMVRKWTGRSAKAERGPEGTAEGLLWPRYRVGKILARLRGEHDPATVFLTGDFVARFQSAARQIVAAGARVGNPLRQRVTQD